MERQMKVQNESNQWRKEIKQRIKPLIYQNITDAESIHFKAGFKIGYRLALQHIGTSKSFAHAKNHNLKISNVEPIINSIVSRTANYLDIPKDDLLSDKRDRRLVIARSIAINLLKELTPYTLKQIGEILAGKDHTTILHHVSCKFNKNGLWFPYFEIWNHFDKLKQELELDFKVQK